MLMTAPILGINTVRIPIGYWTLGPDFTQGTDFEPVGATVYSNSYPRLLRAIKWAEKYDLGVLVDMHGAVGGQNRETHSGVSGGTLGLFKDPYNMEKTIVALEYLTKQLINVNNIVGIEILNEPVDDPGLIPFYEHALDRLRSLSPEAGMFPFYYHNAFNTTKYSAWQAPRTDFLVQDEHSYFLFDEANKAKSMAQLDTEIKQTSGSLSQLYINSANSVRRNMVIDEWSCGLSDNALMGVQDQEAARRAFCTGQMQTYANTTAGYAFWAYKTEYCEGDPNWCFRGRVGVSLPATFYSYPNGSALANSSMINSASSDNSSEVSFFSIGADFASMTGLSEADSAMLLLATSTSADAVNFAMINEILATTDFDMEFFPEIFRTNGSFSDDPAPIVSNPPNISSPAEQSTEAVAALPAQVIPPSAAYLINPPPNMKGFYQHKISRRHRFERLNRNRHLDTRADSAAASAELSPTEAALARGYADGVKAAKSFALFHGSRLGFTGQFIQDALNGNKNIDGDEGKQAYQGGFMTGLAEGEASVLSGLANGTSS
jgi:glucan 1,3-beta-glucosidase